MLGTAEESDGEFDKAEVVPPKRNQKLKAKDKGNNLLHFKHVDLRFVYVLCTVAVAKKQKSSNGGDDEDPPPLQSDSESDAEDDDKNEDEDEDEKRRSPPPS